MMVFGRILSGFGVGFLSMCVPVYQSEISPAENRGRLGCIEFTVSGQTLLGRAGCVFPARCSSNAVFRSQGNIFGYASSVVSRLFDRVLFLSPCTSH